MPTTIDYRFGDIVLVPFPFTDLSAAKKRPAIAISSDAYNRERADVIVVAVTSQTRPPTGIGECTLAGWQSAGLLRPSVMKPVVATVQRALLLRRLGRLSQADREAIRRAVDAMLGG